MEKLNKLVDTTEYQTALSELNNIQREARKKTNEIRGIAENISRDLGRIYHASEFDSCAIKKEIADLMSAVEGEKYVPFNCYFERKIQGEYTPRTIGYIADMVIKEDEANRIDTPEDAVARGYGILLGVQFIRGKDSYHLLKCPSSADLINRGSVNLEWNSSFGRFAYVEGFLEEVIEYKYSNGISEISPEDLRKFIESFVSRIGIRQCITKL